MAMMKIYSHRLRALLSSPLSSSPFHSVSTRSFSSFSFENVGFIGLGNMGSRMADNLLKAGYKLTVHDANCNAMKKYSDMGVSTKQTPFGVADASDVVITMLPSSSHVLNVYHGPYGILEGGNILRPRLLIDSSTIDPQTSRRLSASLSNCSLKEKRENWESPVMLDAPVSGGVVAAEAGSLTFMVGGSEDAFLAAKSLLRSMGKNAVFCGAPGNGSVAKICNNLAMAVSMLGVSEALALGQSLGLTADSLTKIFNSSSARCWSSDSYNPVPGVMEGVPSSRNYSGGFASKLMAKDLNLAASSAEVVAQRCPLTFLAQHMSLSIEEEFQLNIICSDDLITFYGYREICKDGHENEDFSCVFRHYYSGKSEQN